MTAGTWLETFRFFFIPVTVALLGLSFYRTYSSGNFVPLRNKVVLWITTGVSMGLTVYSILK